MENMAHDTTRNFVTDAPADSMNDGRQKALTVARASGDKDADQDRNRKSKKRNFHEGSLALKATPRRAVSSPALVNILLSAACV